MAPFEEMTRDTHSFSRRVGDLPKQEAADGAFDFRGLLHRDGTVYSVVDAKELKQPDVSAGGWRGGWKACCCGTLTFGRSYLAARTPSGPKCVLDCWGVGIGDGRPGM